MDIQSIDTLGKLKATGYVSKSIKQEIRDNLIKSIRAQEVRFDGVVGFEDTVIPDLERAILSRHNILLLGLRGQAKTRIARMMTQYLDEYIPYVSDSELNEDPFIPLTKATKEYLKEKGDDTPISWLHRSQRYVEKLATPDVSISDLIGDIDPIKAATLKLSFADEGVVHYGLIPRANRCIFVINELPDLQARIQVSLFNILQEGDIQIRGFKMRLPLDISFVFTANPEDYTNRGSIITPLKDRISSQILTHYPRSIDTAIKITQLEAKIATDQTKRISVQSLHRTLIEQIVFEARESEYVDEKSGVSARLSISALENLVSSAERRMLLNNEEATATRITDFWGIIPAIIGKIELVYEGEMIGSYQVALELIGKALQKVFLEIFPNPEEQKPSTDIYGALKAYFSDGHSVTILNDHSNEIYRVALESVPSLKKLVQKFITKEDDLYTYMELVLFSLSELGYIQRSFVDASFTFMDEFNELFGED